MKTNIELARECGAQTGWSNALRCDPELADDDLLFSPAQLDNFVKRIRADACLQGIAEFGEIQNITGVCIPKSAESNTQTDLSIVGGTQERAEPHPETLARWRLGFDRYEKARKLNPRQWGELHERNLAGENFDGMIDALESASSTRIIGADLAAMTTKGAKAWADVPDATAWVDDLRGNESAPISVRDASLSGLESAVRGEIEKAVLAERERCALLARNEGTACLRNARHHLALDNVALAQKWQARSDSCLAIESGIKRGQQ